MDRAFADEELQLRQEQEVSDSESVNLPRHRGTLNVDVLAADRPSEEDLRQSIKKTSPVKQCETSEIVEETIFDVDEDGEEENVKETEVNEVENEQSNGEVVVPTHFSHHPHKTEIAMITEELTQIKNAKSGWDSSEDEEEREEEEEEEKKLEEMPGQIGEFLSSEDTRGDSQGERPEATTPEMTPVADLSNDDILLSTPWQSPPTTRLRTHRSRSRTMALETAMETATLTATTMTPLQKWQTSISALQTYSTLTKILLIPRHSRRWSASSKACKSQMKKVCNC